MPPLTAVNYLFGEALLAELDLNCLEWYLLSLRKLFAKIVKMPRGEQSRWKGIVNVPIPLEKFVPFSQEGWRFQAYHGNINGNLNIWLMFAVQ